MNRKGLLVSLALLLAGTMATPTVTASARSAARGQRFATLTQAVAAGVLGQRVLNELDRGSGVSALVTFQDGQLLSRPVPTTRAGTTASTDALVSRMYHTYGRIKEAALRDKLGVRVLQDYSVLPLSFVRIDSRSALLSLANDSRVVGIAPDLKAKADLAESLPLIHQPDAAAAGYTGAGTAVAVMDTGVDYTQSAFGSCTAPNTPAGCKVVYAQDFAPDDGQLDDNGHGTNVAGIVAGVAPGTKILALDVFTGASAQFSTIANAVNFAVSSQSTYNIRSMNMSIGVPNNYNNTECSDASTNALVTPFANARAVGIMPVLSAGNSAYHPTGTFNTGVANPACTPGAMRVGAVYDSNVGSGLTWGPAGDQCTDNTTAADQITCFSQTGTLLTVLAPGALITAAGITEGGTSQASPHVAGAVAVLAAKNPTASLDAITSAIANSGPLITDPRNGQQNHRFDLLAAANAIGGGPPPPGTYQPDVLIAYQSDPAFRGNGFYTATGAGQTRSVKRKIGKTAIFFIEVQNDSTSSTDDITFIGGSGSRRFPVTYYFCQDPNCTSLLNVTPTVLGGGHFNGGMAPGGAADFLMVVKVAKIAPPGSHRSVGFTVQSGGDPTKLDKAIAKVTAKL